jgi:ATP-dependent helicase STH1/SNF2
VHRSPYPQTFTPEQLHLLKNQILAFKKISKYLPLPDAVHQTVVGAARAPSQPPEQSTALSQASPPQPSQPQFAQDLAAAARIIEAPNKQASPAPLPDEPPIPSPHQFFRRKISLAEHTKRDQRPLIPAIFPTGIDFIALHEVHERAKDQRIQSRIQELESLDANLIDFPQEGQVHKETYSQKSKLRAMIELKALKMLEKQKLLRKVMARAIGRMSHLSTSVDRALYRRQKKVSLREARLTENLERQQRVDRERREKQKHDDYLQGILQHGRELLTHGRVRVQRWQRLGKSVLQYHNHVEKEEQRRIERTAKLRLAALKNDDEEAYLKLVDQAKDTRITHLLKQTSSYLDGLAAAVAKQQMESGYEKTVLDGDSDDEDGDNKIDYYAVAHRIKEEVTEQPHMLVGGKLKDYQVKGLQWMVSLYNNHLNGILADEMGLGKTIQTISLITFLMEKKQAHGPFLVIVPLSTMTNWALEFARWAPSVKVICYKGAPPARRNMAMAIRQGGWHVLLTTYEFIIKDRAVLSKTKWIYMIIDEGHRMKNTKSKLALTLQQYYSSRYRLILTGTPLQNNLPELWAILNFALPKIFNSVKSFDEWFNTPFANTGAQDEMKLTEEETILIVKRLHKVLRPFLLRRLKKDVESELPDKVERVVKCRMSSLQSRLYAQMKAEGIISSDGGKGFRGLNNTVMQLKKICNHPFVFEEVENAMNPYSISNDLLWRVSGKFELLDRILPKFKRSGHRVLMFFQMTQIMNIMEDFLLFRGYKYLRLDGSTKADDRTSLLQAFNSDPELFVFILSTRAGGLGLNLQVADTVIIYDSDWNPHQDLQAQDRAHRIGQTKEVRILRLITEKSIEENILARAQEKLDLDGKVIQAGRFDNKSTNEEREMLLRALFESREEGNESDEEEEMDDDELNEILARNDDELVLFKKMDRERERDSPYGKGKKLPRLIGEDELPEIYQEKSELLRKARQQEEVFMGRGARDRGDVVYTDGLTDEQWTLV